MSKPKEIAEQLLQDCAPAHWVEIQTCRNGGTVEVKQYRPDKLQSLCAAYLKAVEALEVCKQFEPFPNPKVKSFIQSITVGDPHPVWISPATDFICEMGES